VDKYGTIIMPDPTFTEGLGRLVLWFAGRLILTHCVVIQKTLDV
jgi:hypothetical protein